MRRVIVASMCLVACGHDKTVSDRPTVATTSTPTGAPKGDIVTGEISMMNSARYGRPPTKFSPGSVSALSPPKATKTASGYVVQFASHASITTPTVYDHRVIVSGGFQSTQLYAFEAQTGNPQWALDLHDDGPSSPACEDGVCVINTESCTIFAVDAKTGKQLWSYWLGDPLTSAPAIAHGRVFSSYPAAQSEGGKSAPPGANHVLVAFDLKSGQIDWQLWLDGDVMSAPVAVGDFLYVSTFAGTVIKLEQATGKVRYAMKAEATSAPVVQFASDGMESMYYTKASTDRDKKTKSESVIRADHNEPETKYETAKKAAPYIDHDVQAKSAFHKKAAEDDSANGFGGGAPASAAPALAAAQVGVASVASMQGFQGSRVLRFGDRNLNTMGDEVIATDRDTGKQLWSYKLAGNANQQGGFLGTAPLATQNAIMVGTLEGKILKLDPKTGTPTAVYTVGAQLRSQPVVDGGWIYAGTEDGKLIAIDTKDPTITGWPTWGGNAQRTGVAKP